MAKVSDFGLARERDYDHKGVKIPIKWTAPEAIESGVSAVHAGGGKCSTCLMVAMYSVCGGYVHWEIPPLLVA